ncbi:hypothetical protein WJX72_000348 [[Myrmecia] bisecta]|uniref:Uncharacterized protein n=1 Tax=[Myrmecia] bisecta TaxID=41462 RepID=A0AAW1Q395_9CHLO
MTGQSLHERRQLPESPAGSSDSLASSSGLGGHSEVPASAVPTLPVPRRRRSDQSEAASQPVGSSPRGPPPHRSMRPPDLPISPQRLALGLAAGTVVAVQDKALSSAGVSRVAEEAAEIAALLYEATQLGLDPVKTPKSARLGPTRGRSYHVAANSHERLAAAVPMPVGAGKVDWGRLMQVISTEALQEEEITDDPSGGLSSPRGELLEINSGGHVMFCFFPPDASGVAPRERCLLVKFHPSRMLTQSEQFANELTRHLGICAPACRILRQQGNDEWKAAQEAAERCQAAELGEQMTRCSCMLVMEYIPGQVLLQTQEPFQEAHVQQTAADLGRLFMLDMLLGNSDRLPCEALGWRGNIHNILFCTAGALEGRIVAIDSVVQRRPPGGLVSAEDASCNRLTELALNDIQAAGKILQEAVSSSAVAVEAMTPPGAAATFQQELRRTVQATMRVKGLLEMMYDKLGEWLGDFFRDIKAAREREEAAAGGEAPTEHSTTPRKHMMPVRRSSTSPRIDLGHLGHPDPVVSTTQEIRSINREALNNDAIKAVVDSHKEQIRENGEKLRAAVEEWQLKRNVPEPRLTTGFLDGTNPIVDIYELNVRLEHMLPRLRILQDAAATARPTRLLPFLYVSGAVEANSLHLLRHLGVTHILNATEDLLQPEEDAGFTCLRCPIRDDEEEDITQYFASSRAFIDSAKACGGAVLVHCHEGKSRSITLALAYLMQTKRWTLKQALQFVSRHRPEVSPNAGFMAKLLELDQKLHGKKTVKVKKTKPDPQVCPICEEKVGISLQSLVFHMKKHHPEATSELVQPSFVGNAVLDTYQANGIGSKTTSYVLPGNGQRSLPLDASSLDGVIWASPHGNANVSAATVASFTNGFTCRGTAASCAPPTRDIYNVDVSAAYNLPIEISPIGSNATGPNTTTTENRPVFPSCPSTSCKINSLAAFCKPPNVLQGPDNACINVQGATSPSNITLGETPPAPTGSIPFQQACPDAVSYADFGAMRHICPTGTSYNVIFCP